MRRARRRAACQEWQRCVRAGNSSSLLLLLLITTAAVTVNQFPLIICCRTKTPQNPCIENTLLHSTDRGQRS